MLCHDLLIAKLSLTRPVSSFMQYDMKFIHLKFFAKMGRALAALLVILRALTVSLASGTALEVLGVHALVVKGTEVRNWSHS